MASHGSPASILVVEDEVDLRSLIGYNLDRHGYEVDLTADLEAARAALQAGKPNLVILDLMLPDGSGLELARQIRQDPTLETVPILFVTARPQEGELLAHGLTRRDDYLPKPFSVRELLRRVHDHVQSQTGAIGAPKDLTQ